MSHALGSGGAPHTPHHTTPEEPRTLHVRPPYAPEMVFREPLENLKLFIEEGKIWMKKKYGFNSKWAMQLYVKNFYDNFFNFYPDLNKYKI